MPARRSATRGGGAGRVTLAVLAVALIVVLAVTFGLIAPGWVATRHDDGGPAAPLAQREPTAFASVPALGTAAPAPPTTAGLTRALDGLTGPTGPTDDDGVDVSAAVVDAATGATVFERAAAAPRLPASNLKLLSSLTVLTDLDPRARLTTTAVRGRGANDVVLVGAGDVMLGSGASDPNAVSGRAGLRTLAEQTAEKLRTAGVTGTVRIRVDTSLFTGPSSNPAWNAEDVAAGEIGTVTPLALRSGHTAADAAPGDRPDDPALAAGRAFAAGLASALAGTGASVDATVTRQSAPAGANRLAAVDSATIAEQVQWLLAHSDNDVTETLARVAARAAGVPDDPVAVAEHIRSTVARSGVDTDGLVIVDACGLADANRVSAAQLAAVLQLVAAPSRLAAAQRASADPASPARNETPTPGVGPVATTDPARYAAILDGLPVAALSGTLADRFDSTADRAGAGVVRAKTGTLNAASTLTGYVTDRDGRLLVFALMAQNPPGGTTAARDALDRAASALAGCGCR